MIPNPLVVQAGMFLAVSAITYLAFRGIWSADKRVADRLVDLSDSKAQLRRIRTVQSGGRAPDRVRSKLARIASRLLPDDERERTQLQARLMHAGIYAAWAPGVFLTTKLLLITAPPLIGFVLGQLGVFPPHKALFYGGVAGGIGIVLPALWLERRKKRRHVILLRSLPDFLDLMVTCVQSGLSLDAALQRVTDELAVAHPVLGNELKVAQRQMELGAAADLALRNFAERSDLPALFLLSTLVEQARRFGTSVTDALRTNAEMLRSQREQRAETMAQTAAVKILFPTILFIFPAIFVVLVGPAAVQISEKFSGTAQSAKRSNEQIHAHD